MNIDRPTFISIETTAFSGATLLAILLGAHPEITSIGEIHGLIARSDPETYLCSCGQRIKDCDFWKSVTKAMKTRGFEFNPVSFGTKYTYSGPKFFHRLRHGSSRVQFIDALRDQIVFALPDQKKALKQYAQRNAAFVESILEVTGNNVFVDSSKSKMLLRSLPRYTNFDVRAIHLVRRAEGVAASQLRRVDDTNARKEALNWDKRHRRIELSLKALPEGKSIRVRYEDICLDTEQTLKSLFDFCGVSPNVKFVNYDVTQQHIIGNSMRLKPLSAITLDERWKDDLNQTQKEIISKIAGSLNHSYGYKVH